MRWRNSVRLVLDKGDFRIQHSPHRIQESISRKVTTAVSPTNEYLTVNEEGCFRLALKRRSGKRGFRCFQMLQTRELLADIRKLSRLLYLINPIRDSFTGKSLRRIRPNTLTTPCWKELLFQAEDGNLGLGSFRRPERASYWSNLEECLWLRC